MRFLAAVLALSVVATGCTAARVAAPAEDPLESFAVEDVPTGSLEGGYSTSSAMVRTLLAVYPSSAARWVETQNLTGSAPDYATLIAGTSQPGLLVESFPHLRPFVCASSGQTLSGAGSILAYWCDRGEEICMRNPSLDYSVTVTATSCNGSACQCQVFPDLQGGGGPGFIRYVPSGITVSAGTTVRAGVVGGTK